MFRMINAARSMFVKPPRGILLLNIAWHQLYTTRCFLPLVPLHVYETLPPFYVCKDPGITCITRGLYCRSSPRVVEIHKKSLGLPRLLLLLPGVTQLRKVQRGLALELLCRWRCWWCWFQWCCLISPGLRMKVPLLPETVPPRVLYICQDATCLCFSPPYSSTTWNTLPRILLVAVSTFLDILFDNVTCIAASACICGDYLIGHLIQYWYHC